MKSLLKIFLILFFFQSLISGTSGPPPPPPLYSAKTVNAVYLPPITINGAGQTVIFANLSYTTVREIDGRIDLSGTTTDLSGIEDNKNFNWTTSPVNLKIGFSPRVSENTSIILTMDIDNAGGGINWGGAMLGIDFILSRVENNVLRIGGGFRIQQRNFTWFQSAGGQKKEDYGMDYDPFLQLGYNTDFKDKLLNAFVNLSYTKQTLLQNTDYSNRDIYFNIDVYSLTPGLNFSIDRNKVVSCGLLISFISGIQNSQSTILTPFLQMNFLIESNR